MTADFKHCDDYIDDLSQPECLRKFLDHARAPAHGSGRDEPKPLLFATLKGKRVRINMASRLGDVGYTSKHGAEYGYEGRLPLSHFSDFSTAAQGTSGFAHDPQGHGPQGAGPTPSGDAP